MITYVTTYLSEEHEVIQNTERATELSEINTFEKTIVYKYTKDAFQELNQDLLKNGGQNDSPFGTFLEMTLDKLPSYRDIVYRGTFLSPKALEKYTTALEKGTDVTEHSFFSTSKSRSIAEGFGTTLLRIVSKNGKEIEKISKFGIHENPNEQEVLFKLNSTFSVLSIEGNLITLEEI
ncbi:ADP-ribosyltransferase [Flavobacterium sp. N502536]|uniref:ADP-ribosyltransferase n=1 Tax=Flavobacterium sp. N502536 TaxID=2986837 RepID=UPI002223820B|nr:ADP-ribosyltransferase [Flavobacterium sp. N502536]